MTVLAIDQGTTSTRALLLCADGSSRIIHAQTHGQSYPNPGWVEHDPTEILRHIRTCLAAAEGLGVQAVGLANQGESCLGWDAETGDPVTPIIVWQDDRTKTACDAMGAEGAALVMDRAGLPNDPYFSGSKLGWIVANVPKAAALARAGRLRLGTTDAWFRQCLTGNCATDPSTASRTGLMNLAACDWDADLCTAFGVPITALPPIRPSTGTLGLLPGGMPLTASLVDQQAALYGHGARRAGDAKITFGTGAFALSVAGADRPAPDSGALATVAWQIDGHRPVYALDGGVYAASSAVNWARGLGLFADWAEIDSFARPMASGRGLTFVPALAGLACPHWDRQARGAWMGLGLEHEKADMMQALLEGIALRMAEVIDAMGATVATARPLSIDGGLTRNSYFCQVLADVLGRPVQVSDQPDLTAVGIAQLAGEAAGLTIPEPRPGRKINPLPVDPLVKKRFHAAVQATRTYGAHG